jgi:ribonuclease Z
MARMILLGVGTGVPDEDRESTHMVWDGPGGPLLIDAGGSTYQRLLKAGVDPQQLTGVLLTHSHCDHINGLPSLLFSLRLAGRTQPLPIYGLAPTLAIVQAIVSAFQLEQVVANIEWKEIAAGDEVPLGEGWLLQTALTVHSRPCLALRFANADGRALVYSADTEPCEAVATLAQGAQVLIHEATTPGPFAGHTSPQQAGEVALRAGAQRLILVHYSPRWTMSEADALAAIATTGFTGQAEIGREQQVIEV